MSGHTKENKSPLRIKRGDTVEVIRGKNKGKRGKVLKVNPKDARIIVEQVNYIFKHLRKSQEHPKGGRIEKEAPFAYSNVQIVCPHCNKRTRIGITFEKSAERVEKRRQCKQCGGVF